jgi:hypothetical protein
MGGGHPDLKMRVSFEEFVGLHPSGNVLVENITYDN